MKIPFTHYLRYWFINSILAIGTGFLIAYMSFFLLGFLVGSFKLPEVLLFLAPFIFAIFFMNSQIVVVRSFWGRERGKFEYSYLELKFTAEVKATVRKILENHKIYGTFIEKFSYIIYNPQVFSKELVEYEVDSDELQFAHLFFKARAAIKEKDYNIAINDFKNADTIRQDNLIVSYWLGQTYEYIGEKESTVSYYNVASKIAENISSDMGTFLNAEKERVQLKGCKAEPKLLGFRFGSF